MTSGYGTKDTDGVVQAGEPNLSVAVSRSRCIVWKMPEGVDEDLEFSIRDVFWDQVGLLSKQEI
jgi:hypothetical protein